MTLRRVDEVGVQDDERLRRLIGVLAQNLDLKEVFREVAAERLRTLEAMVGVSHTDPQLPVLQGRAQGIDWVIQLFNNNDDDEG